MLVAADNASEVHPQGIQSAGVLCCVKLVGNLFNTKFCWKAIKAVLKYAWEHCDLKCLKFNENAKGGNGHLFVVGADEVEDKAPVHERQQVIQEEGQTAI